MIVIKNAYVFSPEPNQLNQGADIVIDGDRILEVGAGRGDSVKADRVIDMQGRMVLPGFVSAHTRLYALPGRSVLANVPPSLDFISQQKTLWWKMDQALDPDVLKSAALTAAMEAIRCGTTSIMDHHSSPSCIDGSLDIIAEALEEVGLRGVLSYEVTDRNGREDMLKGIQENRRFINSRKDQSLVQGLVGAHALFTLPSEALSQLSELLEETGSGLHIPVAEAPYDPSHCHFLFNKDPMERLDQFGLLNSLALIIHGVHLSARDMEILNERNATLVHNPRSNMNFQVGYNPHLSQIKNLALGSGGLGSNMLEELKQAYLLNRHSHGYIPLDKLTKALFNGNQVLERLFQDNFGRIEKGYKADLLLTTYQPPTPLGADNVTGHLLFGMDSSMVESVMINGRMVMENRRFQLDEDAIFEKARKQARRLWERMEA